ncbi:peptidoglycan-binding domain-containing protein [Streptomyces sp. NPDC006184]|uniref:peptidoglycan-binding domain-containing protein n=1 Tax=Streptomyces sp. NPDC006184 TaxID=3155455 RepID=UPI0033BD3BDD
MPFEQPPLQAGDQGEAVSRLQEDLLAVGCLEGGAGGGSFDDATAAAVRFFQSCVGLEATGVVDDATWAALEGPEPSEDQSIDVSDLPGMAIVGAHGSDGTADGYLAELGVSSNGDNV